MVKKKEGNEELIEEAPPEVEPQAEEEAPQEEPPTAEEDWKAKFDELSKEFTRVNEGYKGLQKTINRKDADIRQLSDVHSRMDDFEDTLRMTIGYLDKRIASGEVEPTEKEDFLKGFDAAKEKRDAERKEAQLKSRQDEYNRRADSIYERATKSLVDKKDLKMVELLLKSGDDTSADELVIEAEGKVIEKPNEPKGSTESEEQIYERIARQRGLLKSENLTSAGKSRTPEQVLQDYIDGRVSEEEYAKIRDQLKFKE